MERSRGEVGDKVVVEMPSGVVESDSKTLSGNMCERQFIIFLPIKASILAFETSSSGYK
jgi:hypothetical protein